MTPAILTLGTLLLAGGLFDAWLGLTGHWGQWWAIGLCALLLLAGASIFWTGVSLALGRITPKQAKQQVATWLMGGWFFG